MSSPITIESDSEDQKNESDSGSHENESDSEEVTRSDVALTTRIFLTLKQIKTPSAFAFSATDSFLPNPGLHLPPHGTLSLPLPTDDAQKIISQASQSPFGKGEETVIDTTVRKSWELNSNQFSLKNPAWNKAVEKIVDVVTTGLGLDKGTGKVSAELYKLLLYEPGAFFKPHKDSEKAAGMFATLVVCLPSQHEGGKLVLTHDNEKYEFETASSSSFNYSYAAWYSDITHEVLPVVSGYRLMLTYNLIRQTDFVVPSHDLARGRVKHLMILLEEYESRLVEGDDKLPPMLVHKLGHKYTQVSLKLETLKPPDLAQVQTLAQLATKLGFDIYLATLELVVNTDDEYDNPSCVEKFQSLENVVKLDGKLAEKSLEYPDGALIDPAGQAEKNPFKEDHEGPTGNEGSPATYWYRDTVVALVPPSKQLHFAFKFESDGKIDELLFRKLMEEFSEDPAQKPKLEQLCEIALRQKLGGRFYHHGQFPDTIPAYYQQAAVAAFDLGRVDLFDVACKTNGDKIMLDNARMLGSWAATKGVVAMADRLMKGVRIASSVAKKVEFLKLVAEGFETAVPDPSSTERVSLKQCSNEAILTAVAELTTLTKEDCMPLAQLCKTVDWNQFESKTKPVVLKAVKMTKITFINELMSALHEPNEEQRSFMEMIIRSIWNEFVFEGKREERETKRQMWWQKKSYPVNEDDLVKRDILQIVKTTIAVLSCECVETTIIPAMLTAIPVASKECAEKLFVPLVQMILKNKLLELPDNDTLPPPSHKCFVQAFLTKFLLETVGHKPQAPTSWSLPAGPCKCADCSVVNRFLEDPRRESYDFRCAQARRKHLYQNFAECSYSYSYEREVRGSSYVVSTVRIGSPYIWRITKHRRDYETAKSEWMKNAKSAVQMLSMLKKDGPENGRLEAYLQPYYQIIMNANVKELPDLKSLVTTQQSSETDENSASALNQATNQTGHKREASHIDLPEDDLAKRTRL